MKKIILVLFLGSFAFAKDRKPTQATTGQVGVGANDIYECGGSEPHWSLKIKGSKMNFYDQANNKTTGYSIAKKISPLGTVESTYALALKTDQKNVFATLHAAECVEDDGSTRSHDIIFVKDSNLYVGCCQKK